MGVLWDVSSLAALSPYLKIPKQQKKPPKQATNSPGNSPDSHSKVNCLVSLHILEVNQTVWDLENESPSASSAPPCALHFGSTGFEGIKQVVSDLMSRALSLQCSWSISAVVFPLIKSTVSDCSDKKERQM